MAGTAATIIVCLSIVLSAQQVVAIKVRPSAVFAGAITDVTCTVARDAQNRWLRIGVVNTRDSEIQLDGVNARVTYTLRVADVPCEAEAAYCVVVKANGSTQVAEVPIRVLGCE